MFAQNWTIADNSGTADRSVTSLGQHNLGYGRAAANLKPRRLMLPFALKNPRNPAFIGGVSRLRGVFALVAAARPCSVELLNGWLPRNEEHRGSLPASQQWVLTTLRFTIALCRSVRFLIIRAAKAKTQGARHATR